MQKSIEDDYKRQLDAINKDELRQKKRSRKPKLPLKQQQLPTKATSITMRRTTVKKKRQRMSQTSSLTMPRSTQS